MSSPFCYVDNSDERSHLFSINDSEAQHQSQQQQRSFALPMHVKAVVLGILTLTLTAMGSFIFLEASTFPCDQYMLTQAYIICFSLLYLLTFFTLFPRGSLEYLSTFSWKHVAIIGIAWATNYTFILLSASHLPNSMQVLIAQSQCILIAYVDFRFVGIELSWFKRSMIALNIIGNMLAIGSSGFSGGVGEVFWCFIFMINAMASGVANLYSEIYMKTLLPPSATTTERFKMVVAINMLSNIIGVAITFFGIPLARYSIGDGDPLYRFAIFADIRILYWVGMLISSFFYTNCAYLLLHSESSIFNAMVSGVGAFFQLCLFMLPFMPYHEIPPTIVIISALLVIASSMAYASQPEIRNDVKMRESALGQAAFTGDLNSTLGLMYLIFILLYLVVDTIIPLLPETKTCIEGVLTSDGLY